MHQHGTGADDNPEVLPARWNVKGCNDCHRYRHHSRYCQVECVGMQHLPGYHYSLHLCRSPIPSSSPYISSFAFHPISSLSMSSSAEKWERSRSCSKKERRLYTSQLVVRLIEKKKKTEYAFSVAYVALHSFVCLMICMLSFVCRENWKIRFWLALSSR